MEHNKSEGRGIFTLTEEGKKAGEMTYSRRDKNIVLEHTEVDPNFQGKGIGKKLIKEAVDYARENDLKIIPECSYAKKILERSSEYDDVLA